MNDSNLRRAVGLAGLFTAVLILVEVPLYFVYSGPPPDGNVLTRTLFGLVGLTFLAVFMTGLRSVVTVSGSRMEPIGRLMTAAGLMWVTIEFVSKGLETGAVIAAPEPIDPTITVTGTYLLYGTITRLVEALFLVAFGFAVTRDRALPRWTARTAYLLAVINLAFVPSIYFGNDPANFYAANGWGTTASMGAVFMLWLLAVSVAVIRTAGTLAHPSAIAPGGPPPAER
jgi:hypothetical protein